MSLVKLEKPDPMDMASNYDYQAQNDNFVSPNLPMLPLLIKQENTEPMDENADKDVNFDLNESSSVLPSDDLTPSKKRSDNPKHVCTFCNKAYQFDQEKHYHAHMAKHTCPICQEMLPLNSIIKHIKLHVTKPTTSAIDRGTMGTPIKCEYCCKTYKSMDKYELHLSDIHRCPVCSDCFGKNKLLDHVGSHFDNGSQNSDYLDDLYKCTIQPLHTEDNHPAISDQTPSNKNSNEEMLSQESLNFSKFEPLEKTLSPVPSESNSETRDSDIKTEKLISNIKQEPNFSSTLVDGNQSIKLIIRQDVKDDSHNSSHGILNSGGSHENVMDEKQLHNNEDFSPLSGDNRYQCTLCPQTFQIQARLKRHVKRQHLCEICDALFPSQELARHLLSHDKEGRMHSCPKCADEFQTAEALHLHDCARSLVALRNYQCKMCSKPFSTRATLLSHLKTHSVESLTTTNLKSAICQHCGYMFHNMRSLARHSTSRKCKYCETVTEALCLYQKHLLIRHKPKAYLCSKCKVQFLSQHSYADHLAERMCSGCGETTPHDCQHKLHLAECDMKDEVAVTNSKDGKPLVAFTCSRCQHTMYDIYVYDLHVRDHTVNAFKYLCSHCNQQFAQNRDFRVHMARRKCPQCNKTFKPECKWNRHACDTFERPAITCHVCRHTFNPSSYRHHNRYRKCHWCSRPFTVVCLLRKHLKEHLNAKKKRKTKLKRPIRNINSTSTVSDSNDQSGDSLTKKESVVDQIASKLQSSGSPMNVVKVETDNEVLENFPSLADKKRNPGTERSCASCAQNFFTSAYNRHLKGTPCKLCGVEVSPSCAFEVHFAKCLYTLAPSKENEYLLAVPPPMPVKCPLCGQELANMLGLRCHLNVKDYNCPDCNASFKALCQFRAHKEKELHGSPVTVCPVCGKGFRSKNDMRKHIYVHTGERPCVCQLCGKSYKQPGHLKYHVEVQHGGARPYECKYCNRGFGSSSARRKHQKTHERETNLKCESCGMTFMKKFNLSRHVSQKECQGGISPGDQIEGKMDEEEHLETMDTTLPEVETTDDMKIDDIIPELEANDEINPERDSEQETVGIAAKLVQETLTMDS